MKTKRFCKSTVSLLLVVMMLMSIVTMGVVNVSAAQTDVVETGVNVSGGTKVRQNQFQAKTVCIMFLHQPAVGQTLSGVE